MSLLSDPDYPDLIATWFLLPIEHRGAGSWSALLAGYLEPCADA